MSKISKISGFPEWLPAEKLLEDELVSRVREIYQGHGFVPIETPSVELLSTLCAKGLVDKELYVIKRAQAADQEEAELGLHFDLTVPFARYVAQHLNDLVFPFKRYQLQRAWRGERPQKGRFREFYQFDADIVAREALPLACDAEVIAILEKAMRALALGEFLISFNHRKILAGLYSSLGLAQETQALTIRAVDKLNKIGAAGVADELRTSANLGQTQIDRILEFCNIKCNANDVGQVLAGLNISDALFAEGATEITTILALIPEQSRANLKFDLSLARGLDYYTGLVFETHLVQHLDFGSVASGGRYDGLVSQFLDQNIPGVGFSIGVTRLMDLVLREKLLALPRSSTALVLVAVASEEQRTKCNDVAEKLRAFNVACEVYFKSQKFGKQIEYAEKKGMPYVLFVNPETNVCEIKDMRSGEQKVVNDLSAWAKSVRHVESCMAS